MNETAAAPHISVVIPTYDRLDRLPEVLDAVEGQRLDHHFEIVVVNDGSKPAPQEFLDHRSWRTPTRVIHQTNQGPASARNRGVEEASGEWVAFLGDDTVPQDGWLKRHVDALGEAAKQGIEAAIIGYTDWHPQMRSTAFLRYINEYGLQFGYALIEDPDKVPFNFFYTSNLSLRRRWLLEEPFDLGFPFAAWEDIEVSYRLQQRGVVLRYRSEAGVFHHHPTDLDRFCERQRKVGYSAVVFHDRHPELAGFLGLGPDGPPALPPRRNIRRVLARALQRLPVENSPRCISSLWDNVLRYHYIEGLRQGWNEREAAGR